MSRKTPLSVDDILRAQREAAAVKPKFLSKAERARLAEEREKAEREKKADKGGGALNGAGKNAASSSSSSAPGAAAAAAAGRDAPGSTLSEAEQALIRARYLGLGSAAISVSSSSASSSTNAGAGAAGTGAGGHPVQDRRDRRFHDGRNGGDRDRDRRGFNGGYDRNGGASVPPPSSSARANGAGAPPPSRSSGAPAGNGVAAASGPALGPNGLPLKKKRKTGAKKFQFDWDKDEDTSDRINPVYQTLPTSLAIRPLGSASSSAGPSGTNGGAGAADALDNRKRGPGAVLNELHWSEKKLEDMKERDWRIFREDFAIATRGGNIPRPLRSWRESTIPQPILQAIEAVGYKDPSPIQRQAIPIGLQNRDLIGIAETGSGKTASFVIPMLAYISDLPPLTEENRHLGPYALIMAPTRELAQQIEGETRKFAAELNLTCVSIVGGRDMQEQAFNLRNGAEIIVATPGRLKDCIERHVVVLSQCTYVVMDEADRMVDFGWEEQLNFILDSLPVTNLKPDTDDAEDPLKLLRKEGEARSQKYRVTMLYSATMPPSVERIARTYLRRPATITIGDANQAVGTVEQRVEFIAGGEDKKKARLLSILSSGFQPPIIVFVNQKKTADLIGKYIQNAGWPTAILHSGKTQSQREMALDYLRDGECSVLVATDLAGRGIDVPNVSLVINFQMANHIEAYVHRIGRTGRAGNQGTAITFLDAGDEEVMYDLKMEIARSPVSRVPPELARHPAAQSRVTREMRRRRDADEG
ncbi:mRNA splicing protein prp28 [Tilletia horrida]|uniref:RNA helicase n=1 Tax=Tilletia horrida TaxID=155126 RepID=A0AAN6GE35_9BASI|nr:mRNA splicing protein prp28 [Tilletia horrida]KAK0534019.1 mRNA splicing protein prp28 [Tilletia horrida]